MKKQESEGLQVDYSLVLDLSEDGTLRQARVDAESNESEAVLILSFLAVDDFQTKSVRQQ